MSDTSAFNLKATLGTPFKLISPKGTLLGVLTVPDFVANFLTNSSSSARFYVGLKDITLHHFERYRADFSIPQTVGHVFTIYRSHFPAFYRDGVHVYDISIEELERQPGWSFAPGAGYLRSLFEG